jgi:predicted secreted hydrolase
VAGTDAGARASNQATSFHLEQAGKISGELKIHNQIFQVEGTGNRDHSTGVRNWAAFTHHELAWPVFDDGTALGIIRIHFDDGTPADLCWAYVDGAVIALSLEEFSTTLNEEGRATEALVRATDANGQKYDITCMRKAICHWPFDGYLLNEGIFEYRLPDGRVGYGLLELGTRLGGR